jgi:PKD repeat protein
VFPVVNQTVNFTDQSTDVPTSWTWTFSPNTVTYAGGTNANSQNPQVQFNAPGLYSVTLIVANAFGADTVLKANYINAYISVYCIPSYSSGTIYGDFISLVQLGSINNATVASSSPFYTYYNSLTTDLIPGSVNTLTVSPGTYPESNYIAAWIDFNQNGIFETTEKLGTILISGAAPLTGSISFTVPVGAVTGTTMMRVREVFNKSTIDPCSAYSFGETEDYNVNIVGASKTLDLTVFLEGIYSGSGTMNQANNGSGPQYGVGISDQITVELHNSVNYSIIEHTASNVDLGTTGLASITIPNSFSGSYYISIRHRNSITTTSASPIVFSASTIGYSFDLPSKAYNANLKQMPDGQWVIYSGDVNQDGVVDAFDLVDTDNHASTFGSGYLASDTNGNGMVDSADMILIDINAGNFISALHP